jgi:hypothetical protein
MPSQAHQFLAMCIVRKIREKGYEVVALDGDYTKVSDIPFKIPPKVMRHRPDIIGVRIGDMRVCIGEAKTKSDLSSERTKEQFMDYAKVILDESKPKCELMIAIPKSAEDILIKLLKRLDICENDNIFYLTVPELLLPHDKEV